LIFFLVFAAYDTIQVYAKRLYNGDTGGNSVLCIYILFTASCLVAPPVVSVLGERLSIAVGVMCYATLVTAGLVYELTGYADWLILLGGCILGAGAALLWTAQGSLILAYGADGRERARVFAIFWALYRAAPLLGGVLSASPHRTLSAEPSLPCYHGHSRAPLFAHASLRLLFRSISYFSLQSDDDAGSPALFVIFLVLVVLGAAATLLLRQPRHSTSQYSTTALGRRQCSSSRWRDGRRVAMHAAMHLPGTPQRCAPPRRAATLSTRR
jgi:hypothetical protein